MVLLKFAALAYTEKSHLFREVRDSLWCYLIILFIKVLCIIFCFQVLGLPSQTVVLVMQRLFLAKTKGFFFVADHAIKIWRLFPFAEEALAPLMTLYCHETPRRLTVAHHKLCAAFHEPATASYNIVVFKTTQKSKCCIQIHIIIFLGTSIAFKRLRHSLFTQRQFNNSEAKHFGRLAASDDGDDDDDDDIE